jgi:hypothetical protein
VNKKIYHLNEFFKNIQMKDVIKMSKRISKAVTIFLTVVLVVSIPISAEAISVPPTSRDIIGTDNGYSADDLTLVGEDTEEYDGELRDCGFIVSLIRLLFK